MFIARFNCICVIFVALRCLMSLLPITSISSLLNPWRGVISAYSVSKLALNGLTLKVALDLKDDSILVNTATPGITATYEVLANFGGRPVSEGAKSIVFAATLPKGGPTGKFFKDGEIIGW
ncbi:MAG: hypothetical protein JWP37_493 [Mucilaginibacter sp.]|nr:hypothetical protein [Mucilaginibacter sp.]